MMACRGLPPGRAFAAIDPPRRFSGAQKFSKCLHPALRGDFAFGGKAKSIMGFPFPEMIVKKPSALVMDLSKLARNSLRY
jgi:hypothetical protein